jgi:acetyl-CoA carboxylase biotin carboxyl carrier protein
MKNMERKSKATSVQSSEEQTGAGETNGTVEVMSVAQIQGLVQLLDRSDVSELEIKQASEGVHLVLRKVKAPDGAVASCEITRAASSDGATAAGVDETADAENRHTIVAALVGIFHPWLKPKGGTLVAVGDRVKAGQVVGTIESLNVFNEIETTRAGRVVEVHVEDGQPVEYGQVLVTLDCSAVEED